MSGRSTLRNLGLPSLLATALVIVGCGGTSAPTKQAASPATPSVPVGQSANDFVKVGQLVKDGNAGLAGLFLQEYCNTRTNQIWVFSGGRGWNNSSTMVPSPSQPCDPTKPIGVPTPPLGAVPSTDVTHGLN
jgi:hypothetical protein